jgi:hypothetical protein
LKETEQRPAPATFVDLLEVVVADLFLQWLLSRALSLKFLRRRQLQGSAAFSRLRACLIRVDMAGGRSFEEGGCRQDLEAPKGVEKARVLAPADQRSSDGSLEDNETEVSKETITFVLRTIQELS